MDGDIGVDEFGREHFVVEAPRGRLGIALGENERGFIVIRGLDTISASDMENWEESDRRRVQLMRLSVQVGDRIVAIEGEDVVHCSLHEVISRLSKLSAMTRRLTIARYHETAFKTGDFDVEKLVLARVPSGPLGLQINECIPYGAFVEGFQRLADGTMTKLARHPKIHRGCQIINVNGKDVSSLPRQEVIALLGSLKDQEKEVVLYRATESGCSSIFSVDASVSERHLGFTIDETESMRCVITSIGPRGDPSIGLGDVLIGVNSIDITTTTRKDAITLVKDTPLPRQLYFARSLKIDLPECHMVQIGPGPLGVNLDGEMRDCARITGFTTAQDAERPEFKDCSRFAPGSYVLSIGSVMVVDHDLMAISCLLGKLKQAAKTILIGNKALLDVLRTQSTHAKILVPKGPLCVNFNGGTPEVASISGYYPSPVDAMPGAIENSGRVPVGAVLQRVNALNVSCLSLAQITGSLKKLSDVPKELVFHRGDSQQDINTHVIDLRLPAGPLGIDLKSSISNKVIVDKLNSDPSRGSTRVFDHGGVIEGSEILAIDGFDVSSLELSNIHELLKLLSSHEKVITFSTTRTAYECMLDPSTRPGLVRIDVPGNASLPFNTGVLEQALLASDLQIAPKGSRLVGIDYVDVRCLSLQQIVATMMSFQCATQVCLHFETTDAARAGSPSKPWLAEAVSSVLIDQSTSQSSGTVPFDKFRSSVSVQNLRVNVAPPLGASRQAVSSIDLISGSSQLSPPPSPSRGSTTVAKSSPQKDPASLPSLPESASTATSPPPAPMQPISNLPAPLQTASSLARLSIRTMEATKSGDESAKTEMEKHQSQTATSKLEFLINMASWTGSRTLYRLVIDVERQALEIAPVKATSPRPGKSSSATTISWSEITALDCGGATGGGASPQRPSLFRSSSLLNSDGSERATVVLTTANKKTIEFDMRSVSDRSAFAARMQSLVPSLQAS